MAAIDFIEALWPEAATRDDIELQISIAAVSTGAFPSTVIDPALGTVKDYAIALRTMNSIALDIAAKEKNYASDNVSSEREGELSVSYEGVPESIRKKYPDLCDTVWGVKLIALIRENFIIPVTSGTLRLC